LVKALGMTRQFAFPGYRTDVRPYVADYDVCVVPSSFAEPFGLTVVEGFAFGVPVIASTVGGIPEIVRPGETGLLVPPDDPEALAVAMLIYAQDTALRHRHGKSARAYVERHHDAGAYATTIEQHVLAACEPETLAG
jgi:glycosyltransferase involved in cell wall biosynthesis